MRIALDCERMKYAHTGLFEYCQQLGNALKAEKKTGDSLSFYLNPKLQHHFKPEDRFIDQHSLQKFIFPGLRDTDLWHTTYQLSRYIPRSRKIKRVITVHDLNFLYEGKSDSKTKKYLDKHQRNLDLSDHIVAISEFTKQDILRHLDIGSKPISVIYNGCSDPILTGTIAPVQIPSKPFFFALGTVNPKKNFHVLIPLLLKNDFNLLIAGKTETAYASLIMNKAKKYGVADRVILTGAVSEQEKYWYYQNCEAFLFPSLAEGFGIPPIEAMKFGKPVFLSDRTSLPEIGGHAAYYFTNFEPEAMQQSLAQGMADYENRKPVAQIMAHAAQFNWASSAKAYWEVYRSVLNG